MLSARVDFQFLYFARQCIATQPEQMRSLDASPTRVSQCAQDQRLFELPRELIDNTHIPSIELGFGLTLKC